MTKFKIGDAVKYIMHPPRRYEYQIIDRIEFGPPEDKLYDAKGMFVWDDDAEKTCRLEVALLSLRKS